MLPSPVVTVLAADLQPVLRCHQGTALRIAREELGGVKLRGRLVVPVERIRQALGEDVAQAAIAIAEARIARTSQSRRQVHADRRARGNGGERP